VEIRWRRLFRRVVLDQAVRAVPVARAAIFTWSPRWLHPRTLSSGSNDGKTALAYPQEVDVTGADLIVAAPWLVFAGGVAIIGWRLAANRSRRRQQRSPRRHPATGPHHRRSWDAEAVTAAAS